MPRLIPVTLGTEHGPRRGSEQVDVSRCPTCCPLPVSRSLRPVFEWQFGLHKTLLVKFPSTNQKFRSEAPLCIVEHQNVSRAGRVSFSAKETSRGLPECSAAGVSDPKLKPYRQQCRTTSVKSPWRAYLDLDFPGYLKSADPIKCSIHSRRSIAE